MQNPKTFLPELVAQQLQKQKPSINAKLANMNGAPGFADFRSPGMSISLNFWNFASLITCRSSTPAPTSWTISLKKCLAGLARTPVLTNVAAHKVPTFSSLGFHLSTAVILSTY
jgi:hypothetical protein